MSTPIKICSELPLEILKTDNLRYNDYDFVLFHLYESCLEYKQYYLNMRKEHPHRMMIFDNSAYEYFVKGEVLEIPKYIKAIIELKPDIYIVPDKLMDTEATLGLNDMFFWTWSDMLHDAEIESEDWFWNIKSRPMAVVQGNTSEDMTRCLIEYYYNNCSGETPIEYIAIPFHNSFFADMYDSGNKDEDYAMGRRKWFTENIGLLRLFQHVHLLGSHMPKEKSWYHEGIVKTFDTAYPVKCAIANWPLENEPEKPNIIIDDFLNAKLTNTQKMLIDLNMQKFKLY